jgi:hypothetical protein
MISSQGQETEKAQSLVEFAVSAVVILLLLVAIADFGRAFFTYLTLRDAAQEGAVYASVCPMHVNGIETRIRSASRGSVDLSISPIDWSCHYLYDSDGNRSIEPDEWVECSSIYEPSPGYLPIPGHGVRIEVVYPDFAITTPLLGSIIGQTLTLRADVTDTILTLGNAPPDPCP